MYSYIFRTVIMGVATAASLYMVYGVARTFLSGKLFSAFVV